ncbi:hypothetical protein SLE2022_297900 [Rubroshorea leprosula]
MMVYASEDEDKYDGNYRCIRSGLTGISRSYNKSAGEQRNKCSQQPKWPEYGNMLDHQFQKQLCTTTGKNEEHLVCISFPKAVRIVVILLV